MQRARPLESSRKSVEDRGAEGAAPRSTPLTLVSGAVAGDDLQSVAGAVADAIGSPVAIAIPSLGDPVVSPPGSLGPEQLRSIRDHAAGAVAGTKEPGTAEIADAVVVRIGERTVGVVAAAGPRPAVVSTDRRAWLEGAAAAASVAALIHSERAASHEESAIALLQALAAGPPQDHEELRARGRRLGLDLAGGAVALCARRDPSTAGSVPGALTGENPGILLAELPEGLILGLAAPGSGALEELAASLRDDGLTVALSAPRRDWAALHEAMREAAVLVELGLAPDVQLVGEDEIYRLLIGVLLRDPDELMALRERTISPLATYDARHDTDLLETLKAFLAHDGSTTETADAMALHRHTVGYRLSRVHEVSGLSPYESDGRERLSLGLKAHQILEAEQRLGPAAVFARTKGASTRELSQ
jgi:purine catabolism regulator